MNLILAFYNHHWFLSQCLFLFPSLDINLLKAQCSIITKKEPLEEKNASISLSMILSMNSFRLKKSHPTLVGLAWSSSRCWDFSSALIFYIKKAVWTRLWYEDMYHEYTSCHLSIPFVCMVLQSKQIRHPRFAAGRLPGSQDYNRELNFNGGRGRDTIAASHFIVWILNYVSFPHVHSPKEIKSLLKTFHKAQQFL